jgi:hypothetical protein
MPSTTRYGKAATLVRGEPKNSVYSRFGSDSGLREVHFRRSQSLPQHRFQFLLPIEAGRRKRLQPDPAPGVKGSTCSEISNLS